MGTTGARTTMDSLLNAQDGSSLATLGRAEVDRIATAALLFARLLMECGARAEVVHQQCLLVAKRLGAESMELRSDYASLDITVKAKGNTITQGMQIGPHGVDYRLSDAVRKLMRSLDELGSAATIEKLTTLRQNTTHHAPSIVAPAVGIACAAFGRLLGTDWLAFMPVFAAATVGQRVRYGLARRGVNVFVAATGIAFLASVVCGFGARFAGSTTVNLAMISSVLLLVPGVPALNAQSDIMEGHPTLGAARAVCVFMLLVFIAIGILMARAVLAVGP